MDDYPPRPPDHIHLRGDLWCEVCAQFWEAWDDWFASTYPVRSVGTRARRYTKVIVANERYL